jgi:hypothetical protein
MVLECGSWMPFGMIQVWMNDERQKPGVDNISAKKYHSLEELNGLLGEGNIFAEVYYLLKRSSTWTHTQYPVSAAVGCHS